MNPIKMKSIGNSIHLSKYTDDEVNEQIKALGLVISYLEGRGDAQICLFRLRSDLTAFEQYKEARRRI